MGGREVSGLATFAVKRIDGSGKFHVGARIAGAPIGTRHIPQSAPYCERERAGLIMKLSGDPEVRTPAETRPEEWDRVTGVLVNGSRGHWNRLCLPATAKSASSCAGGLNTPAKGWSKKPKHSWSVETQTSSSGSSTSSPTSVESTRCARECYIRNFLTTSKRTCVDGLPFLR
jgi:hypothetical protein